jgi:hypothetical protein
MAPADAERVVAEARAPARAAAEAGRGAGKAAARAMVAATEEAALGAAGSAAWEMGVAEGTAAPKVARNSLGRGEEGRAGVEAEGLAGRVA